MNKEQNWLMVDMHMHSYFSAIKKDGEKVIEMSAGDYVETLYKYGVKIFSITDHNYFSDTYYDEIDNYIASKKYDIKSINGVELDVHVNVDSKPNAFIHICFYFDDTVDRKELHKCIEQLYPDKDSKPDFKTILLELSKLNCKIITIPHGDKDRGLLNEYLIDAFAYSDRKEFYKYAMYKVFNAFDIRPSSINDSENHWALNFYEKTESFNTLVNNKTQAEIDEIRKHIIENLKGVHTHLNHEEKEIFEYAKSYGSYYAYFSFSDWHNGDPYNPQINNFIFGSMDFAFNSFELSTLDPLSRIEKSRDKSIEISDSLLKNVYFQINGKPRNVMLSPGLNAIVGKRGSGKSLLVSVIRNLSDANDSEGAVTKYKKLKITDIHCENRGGIPLSPGRLGSVEFLKQDEIRDIIDNPEKAQDRIKGMFPSIKEMDLSQIKEIAVLCDYIKPFNNNYKSVTSDLASTKISDDFLFKSTKKIDSSEIENDFENAIGRLESAEQKLNENGFKTQDIHSLIDNLKEIKRCFLCKAGLINWIITNHNKRIGEYNKQLSVNQDNARRTANNINEAFIIIKNNLGIALSLKLLKFKLDNISIKVHPAVVSKQGRYLFATYYDLHENLKDIISAAITSSLTYASDLLDVELKKYLSGDEKRKLKSNVNGLGDGVRDLIGNNYFACKKSFYQIENESIDYGEIIKTSNDLEEYVNNGDLIDLNSASLGMKSVAYLNMLFELEDKILVFDQPEDNIDNDYISNQLVPIIKSNKKIKQLIFVTHNPSVAVYGDAFNYIFAENDGEITYNNFFIEKVEDREKLLKILEGGRASFSNRNKKYGDVIGDENYGN